MFNLVKRLKTIFEIILLFQEMPKYVQHSVFTEITEKSFVERGLFIETFTSLMDFQPGYPEPH